MKATKRFFLFLIIGSLAGAAGFAWFSPAVIAWYFSPPADLALSCKPAVDWAIDTYRKVILLGGILGAVGSALLFFAFGTRAKPAAPVPPPTSDGSFR